VLVLGLCLIGFLLPLAAVLADGIGRGLVDVLASSSFWRATMTSLGIGAASALLTLLLAVGLALARAAAAQPLLRIGLAAPAYAYLAVPAVVLALGFFIAVRNLGIAPETAAPFVVILANALLSLPFAIATLGPPLDALARQHGKLVRALGLTSTRQFTLVELPLIGRDIGVALTLAFCFSLGDLGVISLFGTEHFVTLPLLMYRALSAYRNSDAAAIAALMLVLTVVAFIALPKLFEKLARHAQA
jgi:thiamine transport system permease protein